MNLSELQAEIGRLLNDPSNQRWSATLITARVNIAQTEIQGFTNAVKTSEAKTPVAGTTQQDINTNVMDIIRATKTRTNGDVIPFIGKTVQELDFLYPNWRQWDFGEPLFWYYQASNQTINYVPGIDATNAITDGITLWESRKPADISDPASIPFDNNNQMVPYHMSIVHWVVAQCWMDDGVPESLGKAKFHKSGDMMHPGQYELQLARIIATFDVPESAQSHIMFRPQGARIGGTFIPSKSFPFDF